MWGGNVLRLTRCFSAARHASRQFRWYSSVREPVSDSEFLQALEGVYPRRLWRPTKKVGLAISGGVDSMALATLYSKALQANEFLPKCHAIIIDHKVRPESTEEAQWVAEQLRMKLGLDSSIIPLTWPDGYNMQRFETDARQMRYQALGLACREQKINSLFVAHHGDDQAETVIMRLVKGRWRAGLQGMQSVEWIPECHGIHRVHHSGGVKTLSPRSKVASTLPFPVEKGGIQVLRPLLGFEKSRLITTCEGHGTAWAEDATNHIPTLTARNAVRHIVANYKLPEALGKQSLIELAQRVQGRVKSHKEMANHVFNDCLMKIDIQTASLIVRFPPLEAFIGGRPIVTESDKIEARNTAHVFFQRLTEIVSPKEVPSTGQLSNAIDYIYSALREDDEVSDKAHTVYGVWFRPYDRPTPFEPEAFLPAVNAMEYLLSRQPLDAMSKKEVPIIIPPSPPSKKFHLFDGRFWIRVKNNTKHNMVIRTLSSRDIAKINEETKNPFRNSPYKFIKAALNLIKPANTRQTIPAIFQEYESGQASQLLALPTLNVSVAESETPIRDVCEWEVRYKKIDFGRHRVDELVVPGLSVHDVRREMHRMKQEWNGKHRANQALPERSMEMVEQPFRTARRMRQERDEEWEERMEEVNEGKRVEGPYKRMRIKPEGVSERNFPPAKRARVGRRGRDEFGW